MRFVYLKTILQDVAGIIPTLHPKKKNVRGQGSTVEAFVTSPLTAEALSVCEPLFQAKSLHFSNIWFKTDSQVLLNALLSKKKIPVELYRIHTDIETLA